MTQIPIEKYNAVMNGLHTELELMGQQAAEGREAINRLNAALTNLIAEVTACHQLASGVMVPELKGEPSSVKAVRVMARNHAALAARCVALEMLLALANARTRKRKSKAKK